MNWYFFKIGKDNEEQCINWFMTNKRMSIDHHNDDKFRNGHFPLYNLNPDIILSLQIGVQNIKIAVECKRRMRMRSKMIRICKEEQLRRYLQFNNRYPTFILLSVGGYINEPYHLYLIPIECVKPVMHRAELDRFETSYNEIPFYDYQTKQFSCYTMRPPVVYADYRMRLRKLDSPLRYYCVACSQHKTLRNFAVLDKDYEQLICNACYGFMLSHQEEAISL